MTSPLHITSNPLINLLGPECFDKDFSSHYVNKQSTLAV